MSPRQVTNHETETSTPRLTVICCDSSLNICMHIQSHSISQHPPKHALTRVRTLRSTTIVHCALAYRKRPMTLVFSSQRLMTLSVPREHQRINGLNAKHKMRNAAPQTSRVTGGRALTANENYQLSIWTERVRVNSK